MRERGVVIVVVLKLFEMLLVMELLPRAGPIVYEWYLTCCINEGSLRCVFLR